MNTMTPERKQEEVADLASIFPRKGDSRRPPEWYTRALLYAFIAVVLGYFAWTAFDNLQSVILNIIISLFIAFAIEPIVRWLISKGWKRNVSAGLTLLFLFILIAAFIAVFGNLMIRQIVSIISGLPELYTQVSDFVQSQFNYTLPRINDLGTSLLSSIRTDSIGAFAGQALTTAGSAFSSLLDLLTIVLVTYYMSAYGPNMRKVICHYLPENSQKRFLVTWTVVQDQISGFLYSRIVCAVVNAVCLSVFMIILNVPNWLPLALACGLISQFVPMIGTYLGGALPAIFAWGTNGIRPAIYIVIFIIVYQQIENNLLSPMITRSTMDLNPAIALLGVFAFSAEWGALGGFLALPIIASIQALLSTYLKRYDLVDSELLDDPKPRKESVIARSVQAAGEKISETMMVPMRSAKIDNQHVTAEDLIRFRESVEGTGSLPQNDKSVREYLAEAAQQRDGNGESEDNTINSRENERKSSSAAIKPAKPARPRKHIESENQEDSGKSEKRDYNNEETEIQVAHIDDSTASDDNSAEN
ncbi:AI-2E family transporter [Alloscardovia theropitheci]|nr:AI-2E family transporter [Alloscardovia theropitheci]